MMPGMPDIDPLEMLKDFVADMPVPEMAVITAQMVRSMADRIAAEYPDDATRLREAADLIDSIAKGMA